MYPEFALWCVLRLINQAVRPNRVQASLQPNQPLTADLDLFIHLPMIYLPLPKVDQPSRGLEAPYPSCHMIL